MLAARNRRFAAAAGLLAAAAAASFAAEACVTVALYRGSSFAGAGFARGLGGLAGLVALAGWLAVARAFGAPGDRARLRRGGRIVLTGFWLAFLAVALSLYVNLVNPVPDRYRISFAFGAAAYLLLAAAATAVYAAVANEGGGARGLRRGAVFFGAAYVAACGAAIFAQAYFSSYRVPGTLTAGFTLQAAGAAVVAVGGVIAALGLARAGTRREDALAVAGGIAAAGFLVVALGEALTAAHLGLFGYAGLETAADWIAVGNRLLNAAAFAAAALGARRASTPGAFAVGSA